MWIDVTWGAGGSTADTTLSLCETAMDVTGLDVLMLWTSSASSGRSSVITSVSVSPRTPRGTST